MNNRELKQYQERAVEKMLSRSQELFSENLDKKTLVFQSPTGSGKTFMMSQYIERLIKEMPEEELCFLWISIGKGELHNQSYQSLKEEFQGFPPCYLLEQEFFGSRRTIAKNEVVIANWEKLRTKDRETGEWKNILMKDKETVNFRELVSNTKARGRLLVMIIDESHSNATSERAKELRDEIVDPHLTIEMSATPVLREGEYNEKVSVAPNDVIEEGMIKKEIVINEDIDKIDNDEQSSQELIMEAAFEKRLDLKREYEKLGLDINPLVLVQIPTSTAGEDKKDFVEAFLSSKGVSKENNKLAVWLTEEKVNNEKIRVTPNDSEVEFLIFKQAIDTGWDCPRAQILVRFREIKSVVFEIQTVGRILRMPEAKHYSSDKLNRGYVYTNLLSLEVKKEEYNPNIIKSVRVRRKANYKPIKLLSYYRQRVDYGDLTLSFWNSLEKVFCDDFGIEQGKFKFGAYEDNKEKMAKKIDLRGLDNKEEIILNKEIETGLFDQIAGEVLKSKEGLKAKLSANDLFHAFENLIKINLGWFAPKRSIPTFKAALYRWFKNYLNIELAGNGIIYIQNICLNNAEKFSELFDKAIKDYKPKKDREVREKAEELEEFIEGWEVEESRNYNPSLYEKFDFGLCVYDPCYLNLDSEEEREFIEFLEDHKEKVAWWFQNGNEHMKINFGVKYLKNDFPATFQPDFLVKFKDGKIGIFDTKAIGDREEENKLKSEALQAYIKQENQKGKNLFGGLVIVDGDHFRFNQQEHYKGFREAPEEWDYLDLS
jgi:type III restriction enzyme